MADKYYDELVTVKLSKDSIHQDDVFVSVGGETVIVPRGKDVIISRKHAIALKNIEAQNVETKPYKKGGAE